MAAGRMVLRSVFLMEPCLSFRPDREFPVKHYRTIRGRDLHLAARRAHRLSCSYKEGPSTSYEDDHDQGPPQEAVLKAISEVSKTEGVGQTTNVIIGGTVADDSTNEWLALDQKVNSYPTVRGFTVIGTGGEDFVQSMVVAVESVIQQPIPEGRVRPKVSSRGKYVSVNIGPVQVFSSEQLHRKTCRKRWHDWGLLEKKRLDVGQSDLGLEKVGRNWVLGLLVFVWPFVNSWAFCK